MFQPTGLHALFMRRCGLSLRLPACSKIIIHEQWGVASHFYFVFLRATSLMHNSGSGVSLRSLLCFHGRLACNKVLFIHYPLEAWPFCCVLPVFLVGISARWSQSSAQIMSHCFTVLHACMIHDGCGLPASGLLGVGLKVLFWPQAQQPPSCVGGEVKEVVRDRQPRRHLE